MAFALPRGNVFPAMSRPPPLHSIPAWQGEIRIASDRLQLDGTLEIPAHALGLVLFAHGSGSSRHSPRNRRVARALQEGGLATLLFDLLTRDEERVDDRTGHLRFDIEFLAGRLRLATQWAAENDRTAALRIGYFGASTGAGAALIAAADPEADIGAVVSRGGRPDLAGGARARVRAPTLLVVGGDDEPVIELNEEAFARLQGKKHLEIVPGASHLFEEPGTLEIVARLARSWFAEHLPAQGWHP
jgi:putative phosphoribosyl transferase